VNPLQAKSAACFLWLSVCVPPLAASPGCDAEWAADTTPHLVAVDASPAAFKLGSLVIARAQVGGAPSQMLQAMQPATPLGALLFSAGPSRWRVRGPIEVDDDCLLEVDAQVELESPDAATTAAARALVRLGEARVAFDDAQPERAAELAQQALAEPGVASGQPVLAATIAAFSIERLVDQRQLGRGADLAWPRACRVRQPGTAQRDRDLRGQQAHLPGEDAGHQRPSAGALLRIVDSALAGMWFSLLLLITG